MPDEKKSPLDAALELALYAPLGLALTARDHLPDLIARGRQQVTSQVALARMMGQYAVREGEKDLRKRVEDLTSTLSDLGFLPEPNPPATASAAAPSPGTVPTPPPETVVDVPVASSAATSSSTNGSSSNGSAAKPEVRSRAELSIPGYDTLSASQVVQRLAGLSADELEDVRDYEAGTRGRRTILSKIAQLQTGS
jgi:hypothetical protein